MYLTCRPGLQTRFPTHGRGNKQPHASRMAERMF